MFALVERKCTNTGRKKTIASAPLVLLIFIKRAPNYQGIKLFEHHIDDNRFFSRFLEITTSDKHATHTTKNTEQRPYGTTFVVIHSESILTHSAGLSANLPFWWVSMILCPI